MHLAPLRTGADGTHRLTVQLHPAEMGRVEVRVELREGTVSVQLSSGAEATRDVLRAALAELRRDLVGQGFQLAGLDVTDPHPGAEHQPGDGATSGEPDGSRHNDIDTREVQAAGRDTRSQPATGSPVPGSIAAALDVRI